MSKPVRAYLAAAIRQMSLRPYVASAAQIRRGARRVPERAAARSAARAAPLILLCLSCGIAAATALEHVHAHDGARQLALALRQ